MEIILKEDIIELESSSFYNTMVVTVTERQICNSFTDICINCAPFIIHSICETLPNLVRRVVTLRRRYRSLQNKHNAYKKTPHIRKSFFYLKNSSPLRQTRHYCPQYSSEIQPPPYRRQMPSSYPMLYRSHPQNALRKP